SRELADQQLDIIAPGSWVRGPFPSDQGYSHAPWWSSGNPHANFYFVGGTSMAAPHVTGIVALMLGKNPTLMQSQVESILKTTALPIAPGSMVVYDISPAPDFYTYAWSSDATGSGLVQANLAIAAVP
ncbi:MAG: S8 family serine peptidase, partial [Candidatus Methanomethylicus sp.]|nr:S8 family serine peptidase [Candidatus Methanomethylicus sp.]